MSVRMRPWSLGAVLALGLVWPTVVHAYGEPAADGSPNRRERFMLTLTNQIRQQPHSWPDWDTSLAPNTSLRPLIGLDGLFEAAGFHANDMATNGFFAHESSDGTRFGTRIQRFFQGAAGENIYAATFDDPYQAMTGWMNSDGHRRNILKGEWTHLGVGYDYDGNRHYYVQNFGQTRNAQIPMIPAAGSRSSGMGLELVANFFDTANRPPALIQANVGNTCHDLEHLSGPRGNGTYRSVVRAPTACSPLVFVAQDEAGNNARYPTVGAFLVGRGCSAEYEATEPTLNCSGAPSGGNNNGNNGNNGGGGGQAGPTIIDAEDRGGCRCVQPNGRLSWLWAVGALALLLRRRSR